jgi:hypothetical protein
LVLEAEEVFAADVARALNGDVWASGDGDDAMTGILLALSRVGEDGLPVAQA